MTDLVKRLRENRILAATITLVYAKKRWPNANRVTMPELCAEIEATKHILRTEQAKERNCK